MELEIRYRDEHLIAINKPHGLVVHRSKYIGEADLYALQVLRDQIGQYVYPCHRIDRKTGGILLFALNEHINKLMQEQFAANSVKKRYLALVRGYTDDMGEIDYPLTNERGKTQESLTDYKTLKRTEVNIPFGKFMTSRYSLLEVYPQSGRMHQIRKHLAHINHPIIGDRPHGCNKQNRFFREQFNMTTMLLHASEIRFDHPMTGNQISIDSDLQIEFRRMLHVLELE